MKSSLYNKAENLFTVDDILAENERRNAMINQPFDPVTGKNSLGDRTLLEIPDYILPIQYIPIEMERESLIGELRDAGSIRLLASRNGENAEKIADALLRLRLRYDFPFWAATVVFIKRKGGGEDVRFVLNRPQRRLIELFEERRKSNLPIRLILLKARQWGGSTCAQLYMSWLQLQHSVGLNSLIIAHQVAGSDEIKDMFDRMIASYPAELLYAPDDPLLLSGKALRNKKMVNVGKSGCIVRVPQRKCKIKIGSAERPDSCRGGDYNLVHLSEVGIWRATDGKSPEDIVRSACGGVLLTPMTLIIYESTANGTGNFFYREYRAAVKGESQFSPMFVSWYEIERYSLPLTPERAAELALHLLQNRENDSESPRSESGRYLWKLFERGATLEAIEWYIAERAKYNEHADMAAEYPSDDVEAFAHSGARVFDKYQVERMKEDCRQPELRGEIVAALPDGPDSISDRNSLRFDQTSLGGLLVWSLPDEYKGCTDRYLVVVDVGGRSAKADWSVICVFDRLRMLTDGRPEVCAQWRGHCDADILAWRAARIARFYHDALLVIESNTLETKDGSRNLDGDQAPYILTQIRDAYANLYVRAGSAESLRDSGGGKLGFHTNVRTKPMVISTLVRAVRDYLYIERCEEALEEMLTYERHANGSFGAIQGSHDDILMTRAIGLHIALHEMDFPRPVRQQSSGRRLDPYGAPLTHPASSRRRPPMTECAF